MSIEAANFVVIRDNEPFRCTGEDLVDTLSQRDFLLVQRDGVISKVKFPFDLDTIESVQTTSVDLNYDQYAFCRNRDTGEILAETSPPFAEAQKELRVYENIFDGDPNTSFKSYTNSGIKHDVVIQFPEPIDVYASITIRAGFHANQRLGQMLINGEVVRELSAWDDEPQDFTANYTGQINEFSIRQKNLNGTQCTAVINYIAIDGGLLVSNVTSTTLTLNDDADMSKYRVNMRIKQYRSDGQEPVTGIIGAVDESNKTITLTTTESFSAEDTIIIDQVDGNPVDIPSILDTDLFVCTDTDDVTYKITGAQFKEIFEEIPWEQCAINGYLKYADCEYGCDSSYCSEQCKRLFKEHIENICGGLPDPNWFSLDMEPQAVADRIYAGGYPHTATTAGDPVVPRVVTVVNGVFHIDGVAQPPLSIPELTYIVFDQSDLSNDGHPLRIYEDEARTTELTDGVGISDSKLTMLGLYPGVYYYQCANHAGMGGTLTVTAV